MLSIPFINNFLILLFIGWFKYEAFRERLRLLANLFFPLRNGRERALTPFVSHSAPVYLHAAHHYINDLV